MWHYSSALLSNLELIDEYFARNNALSDVSAVEAVHAVGAEVAGLRAFRHATAVAVEAAKYSRVNANMNKAIISKRGRAHPN